jgi:hypothetical protein
MRILIAMKAAVDLRSLGGVVSTLTERGHDVHLRFSTIRTSESQLALERLANELPNLTFEKFPEPSRTPLASLTEDLRRSADYLHYLNPIYSDAPKLRERRLRRAPATARVVGQAARPFGSRALRTLRRRYQSLDRRLDPPRELEDILREQAPDVVLTTTLVSVGAPHNELIRAAKRLGIATAYLVFSWDNLTNKGLIREIPDEVLVWNEFQAREAVELHDVPEDRLRLTGALAYDHWFTWKPSRSREEFARVLGLSPDRPLILYVCSTNFIAPDEVGFVRRWAAELRKRPGPTAEAGIVVRPHPLHAAPWREARLEIPGLVVWPREGEVPIEQEARQNYFDSIYHADAVVGINTSAQIEAAIVGRPVHTIVNDEFRETQEGTLHFDYLQNEVFGHLHVARTMEEHVAMLTSSLRGEGDPERNRGFIRRFVRPLGLDVSATEIVVETIERLAARGRASVPATTPSRLFELGAYYLASLSWRRRRRTRPRAKARRAAQRLSARPEGQLRRGSV